ncbi:MAG: ANTAR domain-containing protein [Pseudomonadota bacterium]
MALNHDETLLSSAIQAGVSAYCIGEIEVEALGVQISQARIRFEECNSIKTELSQIKDKLEARKLISRAKGFIMKQKQISEDEAYGQLRSSAMNQGLTMEELSRRVISVFETVG